MHRNVTGTRKSLARATTLQIRDLLMNFRCVVADIRD